MPNPTYKSETRAARFSSLRTAILDHSQLMRPLAPFTKELTVGSFLIYYSTPGAYAGSESSIEIWPGGVEDRGHIVQGDKVANVHWDNLDNIRFLSWKSGPWEENLLSLLTPAPTSSRSVGAETAR